MSEKKEWYLPDPKGQEPLGPFSIDEIIKKIKSGELKLDDFISYPAKTGRKWSRIFEFVELTTSMTPYPICPPPKVFSKGIYQTKDLEKSESDVVIEKLKSLSILPEVELNAYIIIHNRNTCIKGRALKISEKELLVKVSDKHDFEKGDEVSVTVFHSPDIKSFSVPSVVLDRSKTTDNQIRLFFLRINPEVKRQVGKFIAENITKSKEAAPKEI